MRQWIRSHLTFANVVSLAALFVALGGTAMASVIITSNSQVAQDTISGHKPPTGDVSNIIGSSVNGQDVAHNSLTGSDIRDRSGVDTCQAPLVAQYGPICVGSDGGAKTWSDALTYCTGYGLRLPTLSEAVALATKYDVPGVSGTQTFWTDEEEYIGTDDAAERVNEDGAHGAISKAQTNQTVCVTDPSA